MENKKQFKVRDLRRKDKYTVDDEYLNGYAKLCGPFGTCVYNSLCRHANKEQESWPSVDLMADQHGIHRCSVLKGIKLLKFWGIIEVTQEKDQKTKRQLNNTYWLIDKSEWKPKPATSRVDVDDTDIKKPSIPQRPGAGSMSATSRVDVNDLSRVDHNDCKDTQNEGYTLKEQIANLISSGKRPYFQGRRMWIDENGWTMKVLGDDRKWHEFGKKFEDIEWRKL